MWAKASYLNHACDPNTTKHFVGDLIVLYANGPIAEGEEITTCYESVLYYDLRAKCMKSKWGFRCSCSLCTVESGESAVIRKQRQGLTKQADDWLIKKPVAHIMASKPSQATTSTATALAQAIDKTYKSADYDGLPRPALFKIQNWLCVAYRRFASKDPAKATAAQVAQLRAAAYTVEVVEDAIVRVESTSNSVPTGEMSIAVMCAIVVNEAKGNDVVAHDLESIAEKIWLMNDGLMDLDVHGQVVELKERLKFKGGD